VPFTVEIRLAGDLFGPERASDRGAVLEASELAGGEGFANVVAVHVELVIEAPAVAPIAEIVGMPAVILKQQLGGLDVGEDTSDGLEILIRLTLGKRSVGGAS
jgi:hypothetical protein